MLLGQDLTSETSVIQVPSFGYIQKWLDRVPLTNLARTDLSGLPVRAESRNLAVSKIAGGQTILQARFPLAHLLGSQTQCGSRQDH